MLSPIIITLRLDELCFMALPTMQADDKCLMKNIRIKFSLLVFNRSPWQSQGYEKNESHKRILLRKYTVLLWNFNGPSFIFPKVKNSVLQVFVSAIFSLINYYPSWNLYSHDWHTCRKLLLRSDRHSSGSYIAAAHVRESDWNSRVAWKRDKGR